MKIAPMTDSDWEDVSRIFLTGTQTENATFRSELPTFDEWDSGHFKECRLIAKQENQIIGWAALSPISTRKEYQGVAEVSIYVDQPNEGKGIGTSLLKEFVHLSKVSNFWMLQASIFRENMASIQLHKKLGFREVGYREKIAQTKSGIWHDVVLMERRSKNSHF